MVPGAGFEPATSGLWAFGTRVLQIMSLALADPIAMKVKHYQAVLPRLNSGFESPRHEIVKVSDPLNFFRGLVMGVESGSYPNAEEIFLDAFEGYLKGKVNEVTSYEYRRVAKSYLKKVYGIHVNEDEKLRQKIKEFLDIPNPSTYRNTLSALKHLFAFLSMSDYIKDYKFKACMPNFDIATPSLEDVKAFRNALDTEYKFYFELGIMTAIRPEHLLRLTKKLFDTRNRQVNTWQKTFSKKNFFFSFYTESFAPKVEAYLKTLPSPDSPLFETLIHRSIQKAFVRASAKSGVKIMPKTMRKFTTNWLRRHGMISEDVDALTSHLPYSVVARHYLDHSRIKEEYDRAMKTLDLGE